MKYLILIHHNEQSQRTWETYCDEHRAALIKAHVQLAEDLADSGEMVVSEALADPSQAKRILVRDGETTTTDGPFAELKEHLAGFYLIECQTMERALEHASRIPEAAFGMVEVRPVLSRVSPEL